MGNEEKEGAVLFVHIFLGLIPKVARGKLGAKTVFSFRMFDHKLFRFSANLVRGFKRKKRNTKK